MIEKTPTNIKVVHSFDEDQRADPESTSSAGTNTNLFF